MKTYCQTLVPIPGGSACSNRRIICVTSFFAMPIGPAWPTLSRSACRCCSRRDAQSRLGLFHNEASNIANDLIAVTLLQQADRVDRSSKKAVAYQRKDHLVQRPLDND